MALLSKENRKKLFKACGLGEYNTENIKKLQKKYLCSKDVDGKYGTNTDNLLRHIYNVKTYTKNFSPEEFKCGCGGKYCTGYPTYMKASQLDALQTVRTHFKKPMTITCGLRCSGYNKALSGSVANSKHLQGLATDFYMKGVTDTLANRTSTIKYLKTLKNHRYSYGNGIASNGAKPNTPNMGNALHMDCANVSVSKKVSLASSMATSTVKETSNTEKIIEWVTKTAWPYGTAESKWTYKTGHPTDACKTAMKGRGYDSKIEYSDCGYYVNTIIYHAMGRKVKVINSQKEFNDISGFKVVYRGTHIKYSQLKKGDIVRYKRYSNGKIVQHVGIYMGRARNKKGELVHIWAEAGREARFGVIHTTSKFTSKKVVIEILRAVD